MHTRPLIFIMRWLFQSWCVRDARAFQQLDSLQSDDFGRLCFRMVAPLITTYTKSSPSSHNRIWENFNSIDDSRQNKFNIKYIRMQRFGLCLLLAVPFLMILFVFYSDYNFSSLRFIPRFILCNTIEIWAC